MTNERDLTRPQDLFRHEDLAEHRLLDSSATDFESSLLRAAIEEAPTQALSAQMLAPLTAGAAGAAAAGGVSLLKWALSGASVLLVGGAYYLGDVPAEAPKSTEKSAPTQASSPRPLAVDAAVVQPAQAATPAKQEPFDAQKPAGSQTAAARVLPFKKAPSSLADEMRLLDQARSALKSRKDPGEALRLLGIYENKYPNGALGPEATVLRVSALEESGATGRANELKSEFLKAHPKSAHKKQLENGSSSAK